jgi:hypothetical protein
VWLLGEAVGKVARLHLTDAESVFTSVLTLVECERALIRARILEEVAEIELADRRRILAKASAHWHRVPPGFAKLWVPWDTRCIM